MRTNIFLPILSILIIASACQPKTYPATTAAVSMNQLIRDAQGNPDLYGKSTEEGMKQPPFSSWYLTNYDAYAPDSIILESLLVLPCATKPFRSSWPPGAATANGKFPAC